ncbi:MAG: hypothetical protein ACRC2B_20960 [Rubrivivax sp.]
MHSKKFKVVAALALTGVMVADLAQARDNAELNWSVTIGTPYVTPYYGPPPPVYVRPAPAVRQQPYPMYQQPYPVYQQPTRWDQDGDGIPNRYDRVYNPRWDHDGDGIPNRRDQHYDARHARDGDRVANWQYRPDARSSGNWGR